MKTTLVLIGTWLALVLVVVAQAPPPGPSPAEVNVANREAMMRELLRRSMTNRPGGLTAPGVPAVPMSTQPAEPQRPLRSLPGLPGAATSSPGSAAAPALSVPAGLSAGGATNSPVAAGKAPEQIYPVNTLRFQAVDLDEFLDKIYTEVVGRTIIRAPNLPGTTKITFRNANPLTRSEVIQLFDTVLAANGISMIPVGDKFIKAVPIAQALQEAAEFADRDKVMNLPDSGQYLTHVVQLQHVRPSEVQPAIQPFSKTQGGIVMIESSGVIVLRDFTENVKRMLQVIERVDVAMPVDVKSEVIPIKYALASEIAGLLTSLQGAGSGTTSFGGGGAGAGAAGGGGGIRGGGSINRGQSLRTAQPALAGQSGNIGGGVNVIGGPYGSGGSLGGGLGGLGGLGGTTGGLNSGTFGQAGTGQSAFQQRLQQIVQRAATGGAAGGFSILGEVRIIADERTNSLLVFANEQDMNNIKSVIRQLDVVLAQVLIEAIIMEVSLDDGFNYGVAVGQRPKTIGNNSIGGGVINNNNDILGIGSRFLTNSVVGSNLSAFPSGSGFGYFGRIGSSWDVALNALASDSTINVLSKPRIQTSHAIEAQLFIGETVPYITGSFTDFGGQARQQYQQTRVGITLSVLPLINPDGLVVMDIAQNIQQLGNPVTIDGNPVPTTTERSASAKVAVRDRDTIMLGGFISSTRSKSRSGVPWLKDIPLLGNLFVSRNDQGKRVELVVMMRPTVLPTPEAASAMRQYEQDNLPGVRAAEREILSDQYKLQRKQGIDPDRPAPMFKDPRNREAVNLFQTPTNPAPSVVPPATP